MEYYKIRKKLACFALVGTVAVSGLAMLTPSASALTQKSGIIVDGHTVEITDEEAAEYQAIRDSYWYVANLDGTPVVGDNKTLYVPIGGTVQNGSTYEVQDGGLVYILATEGSTILNRYGVDVTSVDSEMSDYEMEIAKAIYENNHTSKISFNQQDQMAAEMRMLEIKQSMADMEATGYLEQLKNDYSLAWEGHTWSVYTWILNCRPDVSAKLLEISKTPFTTYKLNPTATASRADMAYFLMKLNSGFNPDAAATAEASAMSDVQSGAWYAEAAKYCQEHKLMSGVGNGQFDPEGTVTRGQLATVIYRMAGSPAVDLSGNKFTDVQTDEYYAAAVEWCRQNGIINGTSDTTFAPNNAVTRQDMAVMFNRYSQLTGSFRAASSPYTGKYADLSNAADYAAGHVKWAGQWALLHLEYVPATRTFENLMAEFKYYRFTEYYNTGLRIGVAGINVLPYTSARSAEYEYGKVYAKVYEYKGGGQGTSTAHEVVVHFDHTPTLDEIAGKVYSGLGGADHSGGTRYKTAYNAVIGISYDAETNTVVAICG